MTPEQFRQAQKRLGMSRAAFARALGISYNSSTKYATKGGAPLTVRLAISALLWGLPPYGSDGDTPPEDPGSEGR